MRHAISSPAPRLTADLANNRFDKAVKSAMVASAAKLTPSSAPIKSSSVLTSHQASSALSSVHKASSVFSTPKASSTPAVSHTVAPTSTTLHMPSAVPLPIPPITDEPVPIPSLKSPVSRPHETVNWAAMADQARWEKTHKISSETPAPVVNSRFSR